MVARQMQLISYLEPTMVDDLKADFERDGFVILRDSVSRDALDRLETRFLGLVEDWGGRRFDTTASAEFAAFIAADRDLERRLYDGVRAYPWLQDLSLDASIAGPVENLVGRPIGVLEKIPLRIDLPMLIRELAVWHQDYFYVKGNTDTVTAWIPLQDTSYEVGCLLVMPGSHHLGIVPHDRMLLGKKSIPGGIYERPMRYAEMKRGDLLLFNALLFHSSGLNISDRPRLSVQARFSPLDLPTDAGMGRLIPVN